MKLEILNDGLLPAYKDSIAHIDLTKKFEALKDAEISTDTFSFYTSVASVFSSKIEGEDIDLDSYIKHKSMGIQFKPDYTRKIDDLYNAYEFAKRNSLTPNHIATAHTLLAKNIVAKKFLGKLRSNQVFVTTDDGRIEYVAASPYILKKEMVKFYNDVAALLKQELMIEEVFYYAACIHLIFVKIHPWNDGNGRCARLIEKWFIAKHLGEKAWFLKSEKAYYNHHLEYYKALRLLGLEYANLDYSNALSFLQMLPQSLIED